MHSVPGQGSLCMNYSINAMWHEGDQPVALLKPHSNPVVSKPGIGTLKKITFPSP